MRSWFASLTGAITLAFAALLIELFRALLDFAIVLPQFAGSETQLVIAAALYTGLFGLWAAGLLWAQAGRRAGLLTAFGLGLLFWLGLDWTTTLPIMCPNGCDSVWFNIAAGVDLVVGGAALVALALQLRRKPAAG